MIYLIVHKSCLHSLSLLSSSDEVLKVGNIRDVTQGVSVESLSLVRPKTV